MALQIKELHIKVTVNTDEGQGPSSEGNSGVGNEATPAMNKGEIISECVEQVMEILKEQMEP